MSRVFTMPDYYPDFRCKGGSCRRNCCLGWRVTIGMQDYFRLLSLDCSPDLRRRLDVSLRVLGRDATPDRYAEIEHDWEGRCRLLDEAGMCRLHAECGGDALSATCRYHPRAIRTTYEDACCVSCSCEALVERLLHHPEPLRLIQTPASFELPLATVAVTGDEADKACSIRRLMLTCLQDRRFPILSRLSALERAARLLDDAAAQGRPAPLTQAVELAAAGPVAIPFSLPDAQLLVNDLLADCDSAAEVCQACTGKAAHIPFDQAMDALVALVPDADTLLEHLLVNHCLYLGYPDLTGPRLHDACLELYALLLTVRYVLAYTAVDGDLAAVIDACADCFRVYEHGNFAQRAVLLMRQLTGLI